MGTCRSHSSVCLCYQRIVITVVSQACIPVSWRGFVPQPDVRFQVFKKAKRRGKKNGVGGFFGILLSNPKKT